MNRRKFLRRFGLAGTTLALGTGTVNAAASSTTEVRTFRYEETDYGTVTDCHDAFEDVWENTVNLSGGYPANTSYEQWITYDELEPHLQNNEDKEDPIYDAFRDWVMDNYSNTEAEGKVWTFLPDVQDTKLTDWHGGAAGKGASGAWQPNDLATSANYITSGCVEGYKRAFVHEVVHCCIHEELTHHHLGDHYESGVDACGGTYTQTAMGAGHCSTTHSYTLPETYWLGDTTTEAIRQYLTDLSHPGDLPYCMYDPQAP
ncbi:hypothetical protein [Halorussus litoreus]|uniref:hypothetical protein n=1 Tax=Halorussus litoreus TaxID=1710536 RepID=UPI000E243BD3|nr:hypothetical protein [Halorussus litoreus]